MMKPVMDILSPFAIALILIVAACGQAFALTPDAPPAIVLDHDQIQSSEDTIKRAAQQGDTNTLLLALQKHVRDDYCLRQIGTLPKSQQSQLLIQVLGDEQILKPAPVAGFVIPGGKSVEAEMHHVVELMSCRLIGEPPPEFHGLLTRIQLDTLAAKLRTAK